MRPKKIRNGYSLIDHTADVGIEVHAESFPSLLEQAAKAMFDIITEISSVRSRVKVQIFIQRREEEHAMRDWLGELLHRFNTEDMVFSGFHVKVREDGTFLSEALGESFDPGRHIVNTEIKGITYHQYEVSQQPDAGWYARIIFDV